MVCRWAARTADAVGECFVHPVREIDLRRHEAKGGGLEPPTAAETPGGGGGLAATAVESPGNDNCS